MKIGRTLGWVVVIGLVGCAAKPPPPAQDGSGTTHQHGSGTGGGRHNGGKGGEALGNKDGQPGGTTSAHGSGHGSGRGGGKKAHTGDKNGKPGPQS